MKRLILPNILQDLTKKMVLLAGPRQSGKTWLSKQIAKEFSQPTYLNFDQIDHQITIKKQEWSLDTDLLILDELHKMPMWKNFLKGLYDTKPEHMSILVTGSASLDLFKQAGDSLAGRYFMHHLLPITPKELASQRVPVSLNALTTLGGFPEPLLGQSQQTADRWRTLYVQDLLTIDVLTFDNIQHLQTMRLLFDLLRKKVGSPASYQSLSEDLGITVNSVKKYLHILEMLFIIFPVRPFSKNIARSVSKQPKYYFYDTGLVDGDEGAKFENLCAISLKAFCIEQKDLYGKATELTYVRTIDKKEIDFSISVEQCLIKLIEIKLSKKEPASTLKYFSQRYNIPALQVVKNLQQPFTRDGIHIAPATSVLTNPEKFILSP